MVEDESTLNQGTILNYHIELIMGIVYRIFFGKNFRLVQPVSNSTANIVRIVGLDRTDYRSRPGSSVVSAKYDRGGVIPEVSLNQPHSF